MANTKELVISLTKNYQEIERLKRYLADLKTDCISKFGYEYHFNSSSCDTTKYFLYLTDDATERLRESFVGVVEDEIKRHESECNQLINAIRIGE